MITTPVFSGTLLKHVRNYWFMYFCCWYFPHYIVRSVRNSRRADPGFEVWGWGCGGGSQRPLPHWLKSAGGGCYKYISNSVIIIYIYFKYDIFQVRFLLQYCKYLYILSPYIILLQKIVFAIIEGRAPGEPPLNPPLELKGINEYEQSRVLLTL